MVCSNIQDRYFFLPVFLLDAFRLSGVPNCLNLIGAANDNMFKEIKILNLIYSFGVNENCIE
jgi:hypothetical protein